MIIFLNILITITVTTLILCWEEILICKLMVFKVSQKLLDMETRQTGNIDFIQGINKNCTNHQNIIQIKRKVNDKAPVSSFQLCSCKVDNEIRKLDSKKKKHVNEKKYH